MRHCRQARTSSGRITKVRSSRTRQSITKTFRTLAGEGGLRPHQLRHFSVTQLLAAGVPEVEVMGRHSDASPSSMKP
jgi:integrase